MAVELKNRLEAGLDLAIAPTLMFDYPTVEALVDYLQGELTHKFAATADGASATKSEAEPATNLDDETAQLLAELDSLSDEELALLLSEELV